MKHVSKQTEPVASSVSSIGLVSRKRCSHRVLGPAGLDHIESKLKVVDEREREKAEEVRDAAAARVAVVVLLHLDANSRNSFVLGIQGTVLFLDLCMVY